MPTIKIVDPVTRVEGHMKVEVTIDGGVVTTAKSVGTLFRGFETLMQGRHPWDAPVITSRICGVCPVSHSNVSVMALDSAAGVTPPTNARLLRNLVLGSNYIQSHILHFYLLAAPDYVKMPASTPWVPSWSADINPTATVNLTGAIEARRRAHEMGAIFGGRNPAPHAFIPGGITSVPTAARITSFRTQLTWLTNFIQASYIPDVEDIANAYPDYFNIGVGYKRLLAFGVFNQDNAGTTKLLESGYADAGTDTSSAFSAASITEQVQYSWYSGSSTLAPASGVTTPVDPNTKPAAYSWLKAPRYNGQPVEVGPLARMWINGDYRGGVSVMHRHLARAYETLKIANAMTAWLNALVPGQAVVTSSQVPSAGTGVGLGEAPRGALGHWVQIAAGTISKYQIVTPTCWNASPMDDAGNAGPLEKALIGTPVRNAAEPIEVLRVVHSYDPCLSCAVHVMSPEGKPEVVYHPDRAMA